MKTLVRETTNRVAFVKSFTDISAFNELFNSGKITISEGDKKVTKYLRKVGKETAKEFEDLLKIPILCGKEFFYRLLIIHIPIRLIIES